MFIPDFLFVVYLSSVARSCATRDASNKDNKCKPTIPAGINRPPPSETIAHVTRVPDHKTMQCIIKKVVVIYDNNDIVVVSNI